MEKFSNIYRRVREQPRGGAGVRVGQRCADQSVHRIQRSAAWLRGKPCYNAGRRNNLWMQQHAIVAANHFGEHAEISLLALWDGEADGEMATDGIRHRVNLAAEAGIKVHIVAPPQRESPRLHARRGVGTRSTRSPPATRLSRSLARPA